MINIPCPKFRVLKIFLQWSSFCSLIGSPKANAIQSSTMRLIQIQKLSDKPRTVHYPYFTLFQVSKQRDPELVGCSTTDSSEVAMLGGIALKSRWHKKRHAAGKPIGKPNLICGPVHVARANSLAISMSSVARFLAKAAVCRNFRERHGNVGIMRSPLRAIALPDQSNSSGTQHAYS